MTIVPLSERQRRRIIRLVKPQKKDLYSYRNLNLLTAVWDEEKNVYLTAAYFLSESIRRTGEQYNEYVYILITALGCFHVRCRKAAGKYTGISSPLPFLLSGRKLLEMIQYYDDSFPERFRLEKEIKGSMVPAGMGFTEWYLGVKAGEQGKRAADSVSGRSHRKGIRK